MNKYSVIIIVCLTIIINILGSIFNFKINWWWLIPIAWIGSYIGKVIKVTVSGFNINEVTKFEINGSNQIFELKVVEDFKGTISVISGNFINNINLSKEDFQLLLYKQTNKNEVIPVLIKGNPVIKYYLYKGHPLEVKFETLKFRGKAYENN